MQCSSSVWPQAVGHLRSDEAYRCTHTHTHECHVADLFFSFVESAACQRRCHRINEYIREKIKADRKKEKNLKPTTANDTTIDMVTRPSQVDHQIV